MIQRIQSLFLLASIIMLSLVFYSPIMEMVVGGNVYTLKFDGLYDNQGLSVIKALPMAILLGLIALINAIVIFLYKKRNLQIRLLIYNVVLLFGLIGVIAFYAYKLSSDLNAIIHYSYPIVLIPASIILIVLAIRAISKDEALVRSYERIR